MSEKTDSVALYHDIVGWFNELNRLALMRKVVEYSQEKVGAQACSAFLLDLRSYKESGSRHFVLQATTASHLENGLTPDGRLEYEPGEGLTGWVVKHGKPLNIKNVRDREELQRIAPDLVWAKKISEIETAEGRPFLAVPIISRGGAQVERGSVIGEIRASNKLGAEECFSEADQQTLETIASTVSAAIEGCWNYGWWERRARYAELLYRLIDDLRKQETPSQLLELVAERVQGADGFHADICEVWMPDESHGQRLVLRASAGLGRGPSGPNTLDTRGTQMSIGKVASTGQSMRESALVGQALSGDEHFDRLNGLLKPHRKLRAFLAVPIPLYGRVHGVIALANKVPREKGRRPWFTEEDEDNLSRIASQLGAMLESRRFSTMLTQQAVSALRYQRSVYFQALVRGVPDEVGTWLTVARMATQNLRDLLKSVSLNRDSDMELHDSLSALEKSLESARTSLVKLSQYPERMEFVPVPLNWNKDVVQEAVMHIKAQSLERGIQLVQNYARTLPYVFTERNVMVVVLVTLFRLVMAALNTDEIPIEVKTYLSPKSKSVITEIVCANGSTADRIAELSSEPTRSTAERSSLYLELELAREAVQRIGGSVSIPGVGSGDARLVVSIPLEARPWPTPDGSGRLRGSSL